MDKIIRDGKVAVIISPGYGAGWFSWNDSYPALLFDPQLVAAVEAKDVAAIERRAKEIAPGGYFSPKDLTIRWVPVGWKFRIDEYDGSEDLVIESDDQWIIA